MIWHFHIEECVLPYMAVCAKRCFILLGKTTSWRVTVIAARSPMVFFSSISHGGFQLAMGVPQKRWMVYFMDHPIEIRMIWGYPYDSGNHQIVPVLNARKIAGLLKK